MKIRAFNIKHDTDGKRVDNLPKEIFFDDVAADTDVENEIADMVSDKTGWCVFSVEYEIVKEKA